LPMYADNVTLAVVFKGPEGVVLAADSRVTLTVQATGALPGITVPVMMPAFFDNATKMLSLQGQPYVGIVTSGVGAIGQQQPRTAPTPGSLGVWGFLDCYGLHVPCVSLCLFLTCGRAWLRPACRGGAGARFHGPQLTARFPPPSGCRAGALVQRKPGAKTVTCGFPVKVCLAAAVCANFGRAFCFRSEWRCRPGMLRVCRQARAADSPAAVIASSDDAAVTCVRGHEKVPVCGRV
jgi:hypothetical protein